MSDLCYPFISWGEKDCEWLQPDGDRHLKCGRDWPHTCCMRRRTQQLHYCSASCQLLSETICTVEDSPLVREIKSTVNQDLSKRYDSAQERDYLYISSALDPRFKSLLFLSPLDAQDTYAKVVSKAAALQENADLEVENNVQGGTSADKKGHNEQRAAEMPDTSENGNRPSSFQCYTTKKRKSALADLLGQIFKTTRAPLE